MSGRASPGPARAPRSASVRPEGETAGAVTRGLTRRARARGAPRRQRRRRASAGGSPAAPSSRRRRSARPRRPCDRRRPSPRRFAGRRRLDAGPRPWIAPGGRRHIPGQGRRPRTRRAIFPGRVQPIRPSSFSEDGAAWPARGPGAARVPRARPSSVSGAPAPQRPTAPQLRAVSSDRWARARRAVGPVSTSSISIVAASAPRR
jgi:hypothetical protein